MNSVGCRIATGSFNFPWRPEYQFDTHRVSGDASGAGAVVGHVGTRGGGMAFAGATALGTLALVTRHSDRRRSALSEAEELLRGDSVSYNFLGFYPRAMETCLQTREWGKVDRYAQALEDYTSTEPLPYIDFVIARGRTLAAFGRGKRDDATMQELQRLRNQAERVGLKVAIPALENALSLN